MSVNTELQALLTKMGGTPLESDSNSDLIKKISNAYAGSGGGSAGGCKCLVTNTIMFQDFDAGKIGLKLDKTAEEIYDAYVHGIVIVHTTNNNGNIRAEFIGGALEKESGYEFYMLIEHDDEGFYSASSALDYPVWTVDNEQLGT